MTRSPLFDDQSVPSSEHPDGLHRTRRQIHRPAAALTGAITAGALALAGFAAFSPGTAMDAEAVRTSLSQAGPAVGSEAIDLLRDAATRQQAKHGAERIEQLELAHEAVTGSAAAATEASKALRAQSAKIAEAREAERRAAEAAAEAAAAEAAAEQAAADQRAAEQAAADQRAAEQAAAAPAPQSASRSNERSAAPTPAPAPAPAPVAAPSGSPRSIARGMLAGYGWGDDQFSCLDRLWERESNWNTYAQNPSSGAYGIPQSLPGSKMASAGSDWQSNPATQIRWGLGYISGRYGTPCGALGHSNSHGWY